jgi:hypothetical protein
METGLRLRVSRLFRESLTPLIRRGCGFFRSIGRGLQF